MVDNRPNAPAPNRFHGRPWKGWEAKPTETFCPEPPASLAPGHFVLTHQAAKGLLLPSG